LPRNCFDPVRRLPSREDRPGAVEYHGSPKTFLRNGVRLGPATEVLTEDFANDQ